ncbi:MAG: glycosyltransferase family 39 protein [Anaerolineae bacterium]|nr:glycosyltransferase family 39 protein [Anaerolineae bacterium]
MASRRRRERWALLLLFLAAFLLRAAHPVSRPLQWYDRSAAFFRAVLDGNLADTLPSEHPGVTVMWLSGAALWGWYGLQGLCGLDPPSPLETEGYAFANRVAVGVLPLALLTSLGIVWGWRLLRRLFDRRTAWTAALLWAIDPFYLANAQALHLDALLSTLMLLSALWMLCYLRERRWQSVVISAVLGGLALLTKITALFLVPFWGLCLLTALLPAALRGPRRAVCQALRALCDFVLWLLVAAIVVFSLWPSMWVQPGHTLDVVVRQGIVLHVEEAHSLPRFHRGAVAVGDPGAGFYLDTLLFRTTFLTLPFSLLGLLAALAQRRGRGTAVLLLAGFAAFYFVQMSLGGRKEGRYMLPVLLALDLVAAVGLAWWTRRLRGLLGARWRLVLPLLLAAQAVAVLPRFPYFGTFYNGLFGGPALAVRAIPAGEFGEGLDLAGQYVDALPGAEDFVVATQFLANEMVAQHVRAPVYDVTQVGDDADVLILGVQYTTRGVDFPRWGALWQVYRFREPAFVAAFDGIPYAWVYRPAAEPVIPQPVGACLGEAIRLVGCRLSPAEVAPGDALLLTLYWRAEAPVGTDFIVFVHLLGPDGALAAQQDNPPGRGLRPTSGWSPGELVEDPYELQVPGDAAVGDYSLNVGMYDPPSGEQLAAVDEAGIRLPEDRVPLATVPVRAVVPGWRWALSSGWGALLLAGLLWPTLRRRQR